MEQAAFFGVYLAPPDSPGAYALVGWHVEPGRAPRADEPKFAGTLEDAIRLAPAGCEQHQPSEGDKRDIPNLLLILRVKGHEGSETR